MRKFKTGALAAFAVLLIVLHENSFSQVRLPRLVSDGMVLQRDANDKIWGWAPSN